MSSSGGWGLKSQQKLLKFLIMFDNSNLLFFPGQFLSGRVIVEVEDDMPVMGKREIILQGWPINEDTPSFVL